MGCSAGFLDVMKIKGAHNAMKSGMVAAETAFKKIVEEGRNEKGIEIAEYEDSLKKTWIYKDLYTTRNFKGAFKKSLYLGFMHAGITGLITRGHEPWSLRSKRKDS